MSFFERFKKGKKTESVTAPAPGKSAAELYQEAARCYKSGYYQQAASLLEHVIKADPESTAAHFSLARCYFKLIKGSNDEEDYRLSRRYAELLERALELNESHGGLEKSDVIDACFAVGVCYQMLREFPRSIEYLERCLEHDPTNIGALLHLSTSYHFRGHDKEALDKAVRAFHLDPSGDGVFSQLTSAADWVGVEVATGLSMDKRHEIFRELRAMQDRLFLEGGTLEAIQREGTFGRGYPADLQRILRVGGIESRDKAIQAISARYHLEDWGIAIIWQEGERNARENQKQG